jgi:hypothetical protein
MDLDSEQPLGGWNRFEWADSLRPNFEARVNRQCRLSRTKGLPR